MSRLLLPEMIPSELCRDGTLRLTAAQSSAYRTVLQKRNWLKDAERAQVKGGTGGAGDVATKAHFVENYSGSCGRLKLALLDPHEKLQDSSDLFIEAFAGGNVSLLDAPSGSGAATLTLLATLSELRRTAILPRIPLKISVVFADLSPLALELCQEQLDCLRPEFARQGIVVSSICRKWNMKDESDTTQVLHDWMHVGDASRRFLLKANTSGFLSNTANFGAAKNQLDEILRWADVSGATVVWIEPLLPPPGQGLLKNLSLHFQRKTRDYFRKLLNPTPDGTPAPPTDSARIVHPIRNEIHAIHLSLMCTRA